jgi:hypothetical protein
MRPQYGGAVRRPDGPVAYFETTPVHPRTTTVTFDGRFSADAGNTGHLTYLWDFGDGTYGAGRTVTHTYRQPRWADAKLIVTDGRGRISAYRQAVDVAGATGAAPRTPACGTVPISQARQDAASAAAAQRTGRGYDATAGAGSVSVPVVTAPDITPVRP